MKINNIVRTCNEEYVSGYELLKPVPRPSIDIIIVVGNWRMERTRKELFFFLKWDVAEVLVHPYASAQSIGV